MAPLCPEEVDVFTVPHSRMKELVYKYLDVLTATNFSSVHHLTELLEILNKTFNEFIAHEQIENRFIMKKLKNKLRSLSIQNTAVCNCHNDNKLTDMLSLLQDGYKCTRKSESDRVNFGIKLRDALEKFTETFLPHMAEEEEVFQPLLMQHFTVEELKQIKATVIQQHFKVEAEDELPEKCVQDNKSSKASLQSADVEDCMTRTQGPVIEDLPNEILQKVMSFMNPRDLCRCAQVSKRWNQLAMTGSLWTRIFPVSWANGDWGTDHGVYDEDGQDLEEKLSCKVQDEDADIDESEDVNEDAWQIQKESRMLMSMCKHLLPKIGSSVKHCDLAYSRGINNGTLYKLLMLCPNLNHLDLTQTRISDLAFKGLGKNGAGQKLKHLDLSGCLHITDVTLQRISAAIGQIPCHMTADNDHMTEKESHMTKDNDHMTEKESHMSEENDHMTEEESHMSEDKDHMTEKESHMTEDKDHMTEKESHMTAGTDHVPEERPHCREEHSNAVTGEEDCDRSNCVAVSEKFDATSSENNQKNADTKNVKEVFDKPEMACPCLLQRYQSCCRVQNQDGNQVRCCMTIRQEQAVRRDGVACRPSADIEGSLADRLHCCRLRNGQFERRSQSSTGSTDRCHGNQDTGCRSATDNLSDSVPLVSSFNVQNDPMQRTCNNWDPHGGRCEEAEKQCDKNTNNRQKSDTNLHFVPQTDLGDLIISTNVFLPHTVSEQDLTGSGTAVNSGVGVHKDLNLTPGVGPVVVLLRDLNHSPTPAGRGLEFLSVSGCYRLTDQGLDYLTDDGGLPHLRHLDLSGCLNLGGDAVSRLVSSSENLEPDDLFYCDNILDGPYADTASGCQNLQCSSRVCCRGGE